MGCRTLRTSGARRFMAGIAIVVLATVGSVGFSQTPKYGGTLRIGYGSDVGSFNPLLNFSFAASAVQGQIFDRLITYDKDWNLVGDLAQSWDISSDSTVHTFHLRHGIKWQDGTPFTSADVKYTYDLITRKVPGLKTPVPLTNLLKNLVEIKTPDDYTVVFVYSKPTPSYYYALGQSYTYIIPKHIYDGTDIQNNPANQHPIGTGPFKFVQHVSGSSITLAANQDYFQGRPYLDRLEFEIMPSFQAALTALQAGQLDVIDEALGASAASSLDSLRNLNGISVDAFPYWTVVRLAFNFSKEAVAKNPWLTDKRVREAFAYAIDRNALVRVGLHNATTTTWGPISSVQKAWYIGNQLDTYQYNPEKAKQLLDEAGLKPGAGGVRIHADMIVPSVANMKDASEIMKQMLGAVGIDVNLKLMDFGAWISQILYKGAGDTPLSVATGGTGPDPDWGKTYYYGGSTPGTGGGNFVYYNDPKGNALLDQAAALSDQQQRVKLYDQWQTVVVNDLPAVWLFNNYRIRLWRNEFAGLDSLRPLDQFSTYRGVWWTKGTANP